MLQRLGICFVLLGFLFFSACTPKEKARRIPIQDFFGNPVKTAYQLSPDGKHLSFLKPDKNRLNIFVQDIDGKNVQQITHLYDKNVGLYCWAGNDRLVFSPDIRSGAYLYSIDVNGKNQKKLFSDEKLSLKFINLKNIHNNNLLIALNKRDSTVFDSYRINVKTGELKLLQINPGNIFQWFADDSGDIRMALASDGVNETLLFRENTSNAFKPVVTNNFKTKIKPVAFCGKNRLCIYAISNMGRDKAALVKFNCATGKETATVFSHKDVDVSGSEYSYKKRKLIFAHYETWKVERHYLDSASSVVYKSLQKLLPGSEVLIMDEDSSGANFIVRTVSDKAQGSYYLYQPLNSKLSKLSDINPAIKPDEMCSMQPIAFRNRNAELINGYLTIPLGADPVKLPVIVLPHGGPNDRNSWGYSSEVQFFANRGFAVFQVNYRGSNGYGKRFWISGFKNWGKVIQDDITDGVQWLIKEGIADKKRIGIYGSGFGGFSALNALCYQSDLYACGASQAGYVNLFTYLKAVPPYYKPILQMYYEMVGNPETDIDNLREASPVFHANKIKVPVFIAQDAKDPRVNVDETNQFVKELRKRKIPVTYIVKEGDKYTLRNPENRLEYYTRLEEFFEKHLSK